jgi:hypothetical protein
VFPQAAQSGDASLRSFAPAITARTGAARADHVDAIWELRTPSANLNRNDVFQLGPLITVNNDAIMTTGTVRSPPIDMIDSPERQRHHGHR